MAIILKQFNGDWVIELTEKWTRKNPEDFEMFLKFCKSLDTMPFFKVVYTRECCTIDFENPIILEFWYRTKDVSVLKTVVEKLINYKEEFSQDKK